MDLKLRAKFKWSLKLNSFASEDLFLFAIAVMFEVLITVLIRCLMVNLKKSANHKR